MHANVALELLEQHDYFVGAEPLVDVEGMSSARVCNFLNGLVARLEPGECYLEIGTFKGRTLISAALGNREKLCIGCDKFRTWGRYTGPGILARRAIERNLARYRPQSAEIRLFAMPYRELFAQGLIPQPVGVFFYDGDHSAEGTWFGLVGASAWLSERAIIAVDDWNDPIIRRATRDAFRAAKLRTLWHASLPGDVSSVGWWNGLGVYHVEKERAALRVKWPDRAVQREVQR